MFFMQIFIPNVIVELSRPVENLKQNVTIRNLINKKLKT